MEEKISQTVLLLVLCCATFSEVNGASIPASRLDYPRALSYPDAVAFCKRLGFRLRAPRAEFLEETLSGLGKIEFDASFFLPGRHFPGGLCSVLRVRSRFAGMSTFRALGSCRLKRFFVCEPVSGLAYVRDARPPNHTNKKGRVRFSAGNTVVGARLRGDVNHNGAVKSGNATVIIRTEETVSEMSADEDGIENETTEISQTTTSKDENTAIDEYPPDETTGVSLETVSEMSPDGDAIMNDTTEVSTTTTSNGEDAAMNETTVEPLTTTSDIPDVGNGTNVTAWSGIRTATIALAPINALFLGVCLWAFCCTEFLESVRSTLHLHVCAMLCVGQLSLVISSTQCSAAVGAQLQFVYLCAVTFSALEGVLLMHASFSEDAPSMSLFYVTIGYSLPLIFTAAGYVKLREDYRQFEQLCVLDMKTGAGWLMLGPVIGMIFINVTAVVVYEFRISYLSENAAKFPQHLTARPRLIRSLGVTTFFVGLQWIFGSIIQLDQGAFSVLFFSFNSAASIVILINHVACDRYTRASMARVLGNRGRTARRLADLLRPAPPKINGIDHKVSYHKPPRVSETLRSTLDRGIRPSIHLIRPLDHIPVSK